MKKFLIIILFIANYHFIIAWQQRVIYKMEITLDALEHQYKGTQKLTYTNNSSDTLNKVFYHLYYNAFQKGSMMSIYNKEHLLEDNNKSISDFENIPKDEAGLVSVDSLKQNGKLISFTIVGTI
ncbi:MAG: M1 family peptidase, partial [Candidatus Kapaibacterium sp.]